MRNIEIEFPIIFNISANNEAVQLELCFDLIESPRGKETEIVVQENHAVNTKVLVDGKTN